MCCVVRCRREGKGSTISLSENNAIILLSSSSRLCLYFLRYDVYYPLSFLRIFFPLLTLPQLSVVFIPTTTDLLAAPAFLSF